MRHHPNDEDLLDYAAGRFYEPFAVLIASHLTLCPTCRATVADYETLGGAAVEAGPEAMLEAGSLDAVLARLDEPEPILARVPTPPPVGDLKHLPSPLRSFLGGQPAWKKVMSGLEEVTIGKGEIKARLMRIAPGCAMPRHTHDGREMLIVLDGGYRDEFGSYDRGDVGLAEKGVVHKPIADPVEGCLCFAVTDAPLKLTGPIGRVLNLFIRY